ncbi:MAG: YdcF family protein [Alphaproteobacteria bacterium]
MRTALDILVLWPMPALWLALLGLALVLCRRRPGRGLLVVALASLLAASLPATGRLLTAGLRGSAPLIALDGDLPPCAAAVVVPTGGLFIDVAGGVHASSASVWRAAAGSALAQRYGLPLIVAGGAVGREGPSEAEITIAHLALAGAVAEASPRDTHETGPAVAARLDAMGLPRAVVVVTDAIHIARAAASLRHAGVTVCAALSATPRPQRRSATVTGLVPRASAFRTTGGALYEYVGIAAYVALGRLSLADL